MEAQELAIRAECDKRGLALLDVYSDLGKSAKDLHRPALQKALSGLQEGRGDVLMVSRLDRLSRSVRDASEVMDTAERQGWALVALDCAVDMTTPQGQAMAQVQTVFGQLERRLIGQRTRAAMAVARAQGKPMGRPTTLPPEVKAAIVDRWRTGSTWTAIAAELNERGIPTAQGGARWYPATVRYVVMGNERAG